MIGAKQLVFGAQQYVAGQGSGDYSPEAGLSNVSTTLNPFIYPGQMRGTTVSTDISTNIASNFIASCEDSNSVSPNARYYVDDAANYYYTNAVTVTKVKTGSATTKYIAGRTDFISFNGNFYASLTDALAKWDGSTTLNEAYQSFADGNAHHPMLIFESLLWVADGNTLSSLDSAGTYATSVLTLSPKEKIVALGIDPGTGLMMISAQTVYDVSDSTPSQKIIYLYDGYSTKARRKVLVDDLVTAFYNVGGTVFVGAGLTIGQWNGAGISFLRKLQNATNVNTELPYKHHFGNFRNVLLVADGTALLAYGEIVPGRKGWYTVAGAISANKITCVSPVGANKSAISSLNTGSTYDLRVIDFNTSGSAVVAFAPAVLPRPIFVHRIRVITTPVPYTGGTDIVMTAYDERGNPLPISNANRIISVPNGSSTYNYSVFDFDYGGVKTQVIQPIVTSAAGYGVIQTIVYYDPAE